MAGWNGARGFYQPSSLRLVHGPRPGSHQNGSRYAQDRLWREDTVQRSGLSRRFRPLVSRCEIFCGIYHLIWMGLLARCTSRSLPPAARIPQLMHVSFYAHLYNKCVFDAITSVTSGNDAALFARSATAGGQRFPVHWGGDCESSYAAMAGTLRGGLSLACSGFGFWSHDIGGFEVSVPSSMGNSFHSSGPAARRCLLSMGRLWSLHVTCESQISVPPR